MTSPPGQTKIDEDNSPETDYPESEYGEASAENALAPPTDLNVGTDVPDELGGDGDNPADKQK